MNSFLKYVKGILKALKGQYPYEQMEQLDRIKETIHQDSIEGLPGSDVRMIVDRYHQLTKKGWKSVYTLPSADLARSMAKGDGREAAKPIMDPDIELYRDPYSVYPVVPDDDHSYH